MKLSSPYFIQNLCSILVLFLLTACVNFNGIHSTAHINQPYDLALGKQQGQWPTSAWVTRVGGQPLQQLVDEALGTNPDLQVAAARLAAAQAMVEAADATSKPNIGANLSAAQVRFAENSHYPPPLNGNYVNSYAGIIKFSYDFDFWGKHRAQLHAALSQQQAAQAEQYAARLVLTTAISKTWLQLGRQYRQLDLTIQQVALRHKLEKLTQERIAIGLDTQKDNQQSQQQIANLRAEQAQWEETIILTRNQLAALLGQSPNRGLLIARPFLPHTKTPLLPAQLGLDLLGRRPDIVAARWQVEASQSDIQVAQAAFYPDVNLSAVVGLLSLDFSQFLTHGSKIIGVGPAVRLPIFEGGALRAQLKGRVAAYDAAVASYNQTLNQAFHEVADSMQSLYATASQEESQQIAVAAAEHSMRLTEQQQRVGTVNMLQVISAQLAWLAQRKQALEVYARRADLYVNLIKALGGGFEANAEGLAPALLSSK